MAYEKLFSSDWLGSDPVFYNTKTGVVSRNFNEVVDLNDLSFDPEGFNNYLDYGYSVFEQTPVKNVMFLRYSSDLVRHDDGRLEVIYRDDPAGKALGTVSSPAEALTLVQRRVQAWEAEEPGEIVIPTSGGFDSRLLNLSVKDRTRIRSFTYGISHDQDDSREAVYAHDLARTLGTSWELIPIDDYNRYLGAWDEAFGASMHAHGMYHMQFYERMRSRVETGARLLSGIIGDAWAGSVNLEPIRNIKDLKKLAYSHNMHADSSFSQFPKQDELKRAYLEKNKEKLLDSRWLVVEAMRTKMLLLSYLMRVPAQFGFRPWSPFLDMDVALSMLNLPPGERRDRAWQRAFFKEEGVYLEDRHLHADASNTLLLHALEEARLEPLSEKRLAEVVEPEYVRQTNTVIARARRSLAAKRKRHQRLAPLYRRSLFLERLAYRLGVDRYHLGNAEAAAYHVYITLKPIDALLKRRDERQ